MVRLDFMRRVANKPAIVKHGLSANACASNAPKLHANEKPALGATVMADRCRLPIRHGGSCKPHSARPIPPSVSFHIPVRCDAGGGA
jgi:hypothetical protein